jgi:hypothetical protein
MENFGNIKDTFTDIVIESVFKKNDSGKKLFSKFIKLIKENDSLGDQYLIYKNLQSKKFNDSSEAKDFIKENISLLKSLDKKELEKGNEKLFKLLKGKSIVKENSEFYNHIKLLAETKKTPKNIEKINDSINHIKGLMLEKELVDETDEIVSELPPSVLTQISVNKFNSKYANVSESEKEIIKTILNGDDKTKEDTYKTLKRECIDIIDNNLTESSDIDIKDKLLRVKDKLLNMNFNKENFVSDINKVYDLKQSISSIV